MDFERARFNMIEQQIRPCDVLDRDVLALLDVVKREQFVPAAYRGLAFADLELPLTEPAVTQQAPNRTMLAPKIDARILQELAPRSHENVLEVGTGSGYMAALLAHRANKVTTVEIDAELAARARANLSTAGIVNVDVVEGNGIYGWLPAAPYDVICVSGGVPLLPPSLIDQLKIGGRLTAFVGTGPVMVAQLVTRVSATELRTENLFETQIAELDCAPQLERFVF